MRRVSHPAHDAPPITLTAHVDPAAGPATLENTATVQGPLPDPAPGNNSDTDSVVVVDRANVAITKEVTTPVPPDAVLAGEEITYTLHVTNDGPSVADAVTVTDSLPAGTTFVSADGPGWDCSAAATVLCSRETMAVGSSIITLVVRVGSTVQDGTTIRNVAGVATATPGDDPADNTASATVLVGTEADLSLTKTHREDPATPGRAVTFDLAVHNDGPSAAQLPIVVTDTLPAGFSFVSAGSGWLCTAADPTATGQVVTCDLDALLPLDTDDDAPVLSLVVQVASDVAPGAFVNSARVNSPTDDPAAGNNEATDRVQVAAVVDLSVRKSHAGPVRIGDPLGFAFVVRNAGPSDATGVVLTDTAPTGLVPVAVQSSPGWTCAVDGQQVRCALGSALAAGAQAPPLSLTYTVTAAAYPTAKNTVVVAGDGREATPDDNTAADVVTVPPKVDLAVQKTHEGALRVGVRAAYLLVVSNAGPTADPGPVTVTDTLPAGLRYVSATGDGWGCTATGPAVTCTRAAGLAAGGSTQIRLVVDMLPAAYPSVSNTASVSTSAEDTEPGNNTATDTAPVGALADLALTKRVSAPGDGTARWTIRVVNHGPNVADRPFTVVDTLPAGLSYTSATGVGWRCGAGGRVVTCTHPAPLAVAAATTITIETTVVAATGQVVINTATVTSPQDHLRGNNTATAALDVDSGVLGEIAGAGGTSGQAIPRTGADVGRQLALAMLLLTCGAFVLAGERRAGRHRQVR